jgi:DNA-binding NtrC family response regulator
MLKRHLEEAGHLVAEISEENHGLRYYQDNPVDVVIPGIIPPDLEGLKTINRFRHKYPEAHIIVIENGYPAEQNKTHHPWKSAKIFGAIHTFVAQKEIHQILATIKRLPTKKLKYMRRKRRYLGFVSN